jgi:uncharacterized membrane protein YqaE (UPF0057 family)
MQKNILLILLFSFYFSLQPRDAQSSVIIPRETVNSTLITDSVNIKSALADFKNLSRKEKKERLKFLKTAIKDFKDKKKAGKTPSTNTLLMVIIAILLPPLAVYLHEGVINSKFWIDLLLTLLFILPGIIYALVVVLNKD